VSGGHIGAWPGPLLPFARGELTMKKSYIVRGTWPELAVAAIAAIVVSADPQANNTNEAGTNS
jgi:hypothetical protein